MDSEQIRPAFEAWLKNEDFFKYENISLDRNEDGVYVDSNAGVQRMWLSWWAAHSQPESSPEVPENNERTRGRGDHFGHPQKHHMDRPGL